MTSENHKALHTSAEVFDAFIERSWRSNAERQKAKGAEFVIGNREGVYMWDIEGKRRLIDCGTGGGVHALGHRHPEILAALRQALDDGRDTGLWSVPNAKYLELQDKLATLAPKPHLNRSVITLCSTLSVDLATMFAFRVTKRQKMLAYRHGYHGHTGFAAIVTGSPEEGIIDHYNLPSHSNFLERFGDIEELDRLLTCEIAGFIIEPMDYETFEAASNDFFTQASRLCKERGVLFIVDETRAGLGRTGTLWASEQYDIDPDMMITGKGLSGGLYPASAVLMRTEIYEQCMNQHRFAYISSLGGNEISCIVAAKVLDVASSPALLENVRKVGAYLHNAFQALCSKHPDVLKGVTSFGLAVSVQVANRDVGRELYKKILADGVLCHSVAEIDPPGLKFFPPLVLTEAEADQVVDALDRAGSTLRKSVKSAA